MLIDKLLAYNLFCRTKLVVCNEISLYLSGVTRNQCANTSVIQVGSMQLSIETMAHHIITLESQQSRRRWLSGDSMPCTREYDVIKNSFSFHNSTESVSLIDNLISCYSHDRV